VPEDGTDGPPDITLKLGSGSVDHIPEVHLVGQFGEGGQEGFYGGIGTGSSNIGNNEGDDTREDVGASTSCLPADRTTPIVTNADGFSCYLGAC